MTFPSREFLIETAEVAETFGSYQPAVRRRLMELRHLIFTTADETPGVGRIEETLKWGQPSYLTSHTRSGSTIRIAATKPGANGDYAMYFTCHTNLIDRFKIAFGNTLTYETNRGLLFTTGSEIPVNEVRQCVTMALTYHLTRPQHSPRR